jgi:hypothetical protein
VVAVVLASGLPLINFSRRRAPSDSREEFFSQLNTCGHSPYITSSLMRGWVWHLQMLLALAGEFILGSESRGTVSDSRLLFLCPPTTRRTTVGGFRPRLHTGIRECLSAENVITDSATYRCGWPITVAARSKARSVFDRSNTGVVNSNLTRGMDVCLRLFCVCDVLCRQRPWDGLITRPRNPTDWQYD